METSPPAKTEYVLSTITSSEWTRNVSTAQLPPETKTNVLQLGTTITDSYRDADFATSSTCRPCPPSSPVPRSSSSGSRAWPARWLSPGPRPAPWPCTVRPRWATGPADSALLLGFRNTAPELLDWARRASCVCFRTLRTSSCRNLRAPSLLILRGLGRRDAKPSAPSRRTAAAAACTCRSAAWSSRGSRPPAATAGSSWGNRKSVSVLLLMANDQAFIKMCRSLSIN